jgi:hypothetical protein
MNEVQLTAGAGTFSPCHHIQMGSGAHLASYPMGTRRSFPGGKVADHSPPPSADVKNVWNYTSTPPISLHSMMLN